MLIGKGLSHNVVLLNYLSNQTLFSWVRNSELLNRGTSLIWNSSIKVYHWITRSLNWKVGSGEEIRLGIDPFLGLEVKFLLSSALIAFLIHKIFGILVKPKIVMELYFLMYTGFWRWTLS